MSTPHIGLELQQRGLIHQSTHPDEILQALSHSPLTFYTGYDPTADSLHIGHLITLMTMRHLAKAGHRPIVLLGGGTAQIGDPSGKTQARRLLENSTITQFQQALEKQLQGFFSPQTKTLFVDNNTWLKELSAYQLLRDIGQHFSVNRMLTADAYRSRQESGLTYLEFSYQLLQAYDFLVLARQHHCVLQIGGADQWSNILAGIELNRRVDQRQVYGLTIPLCTTADGQKMGKSEGKAIWLDANKTSPYAYYQYWINVDDQDVTKFLYWFTDLPTDEIKEIAQLEGAHLNPLKSILAYETTALWHGRLAAEEAHGATAQAFGSREIGTELLPSSTVPRKASHVSPELLTYKVASSLLWVELLVEVGFADSKNAARRLIQQGAVKLDQHNILDEKGYFDFSENQEKALLEVGKKRKIYLVKAP
jgi:tyrosyl-tRNA synthetase